MNAAGANRLEAALAPDDDAIQPFMIEDVQLRGRLVRLGPALDAIVRRHDHPPPVANLLAETAVLACTLANSIKYEGIFTLQAQGDGPVRVVMADVTSQGHVRAYARVDRARLETLGPAAPANPVPRYLGAGRLVFTVDQGQHTERYQGVVDLAGSTLAECAQHYFRQSEQIETIIHLAAGVVGGSWRAGGLMVQRLPRSGGTEAASEWTLAGMQDDEHEDGWRRVAALVGSVKDAELLDPVLPPAHLLYRLFHEDGVRLYQRRPLIDRCRCSRLRAANALRMLGRAEAEAGKTDGVVTVTCEFCSRHERFDDRDLDAMFPPAARH
ncbi:MAG: Hsp33 family molecular chaperone HslO [Rhodospirillaceae bacterium]|nr:Hsp33 family molecular chaperone HslO [Rhodospirillaceae bacterium]